MNLKLAEPGDSKMIYDLIDTSRENLRQWLTWVDLSNSSDITEKYLIENSTGDFYSGRMIFEIIVDNNFCGMIDLHNGNSELKSVDIGYWVGEKFQNRGIATSGCRKIIKMIFENYDIETIHIKCAEENIKSIAIPLKLHFELVDVNSEITIREDKHRLFDYSLTKDKWMKSDSYRMENQV